MLVDDLIEKLHAIGLDARAYRGRNMRNGLPCVAAIVPALRDLALLGPDLHPGLEIDNYALGFIAYWPQVRLPVAHELLKEQSN